MTDILLFADIHLDKALARIDEMKYGKDFHLVSAPKMVTPEPTPKSRRAFWTDEEVQRLQVRVTEFLLNNAYVAPKRAT